MIIKHEIILALKQIVIQSLQEDKVSDFWSDTSSTVTILSFRTDMSEQTVQTQIRLLPEEQSDQGLHCLLFHSIFFDEML